MFSVIAIICIFIEVFTAGILCVGTYTFAKKYFSDKKKVFLYLCLIFFLSFICTVGTLLSQIMSNLDTFLSHLVSNHLLSLRSISALLVLNSLAVWFFLVEKFKIRFKWLSLLMSFLGLISIVALFYPYIGFPIISFFVPLIEYLCITTIREFWILIWIILGCIYLFKTTNGNNKERNLNVLCGISAILISCCFISALFLNIAGQEFMLLASWTAALFSFSGFLLGNVIAPDDDIALSPLNYIRTRILFKLILIFVFLTILIVEATTIATIAISRSSFSKVVTESNRHIIYYEMRIIEANSLLFVIVGIIITVIVGIYFAKTIEYSIKGLIDGTLAIKKGNLKYKINTGSIDEIGQLARAFNEMTGELSESQEHLVASEKLAALGTMAAGMAHEIKNPLVALRTFTQILPLKWNDSEFREKFTAIVPTEIEKINKIAENLLKFGKPSKPEFKNINVNTVLEEILDLLENQFKKNNIRITTKFVQTPIINGDDGQLSQAFLNILLNAVQAMPSGGELIVKTDVGEIVKLGQDAPRRKTIPTVFVEITDSGAGIPEENLKNLFDPFFTTKEKGTGMGLPITLRIIEEHNGSIKVKSQKEKGTTFLIMLPQIEGGIKQ